MKKYGDAGVREYWIVDYFKRITIRYDFMHDIDIAIFPFDAPVPVAISGGECTINMEEIETFYRDMGMQPDA